MYVLTPFLYGITYFSRKTLQFINWCPLDNLHTQKIFFKMLSFEKICDSSKALFCDDFLFFAMLPELAGAFGRPTLVETCSKFFSYFLAGTLSISCKGWFYPYLATVSNCVRSPMYRKHTKQFSSHWLARTNLIFVEIWTTINTFDSFFSGCGRFTRCTLIEACCMSLVLDYTACCFAHLHALYLYLHCMPQICFLDSLSRNHLLCHH